MIYLGQTVSPPLFGLVLGKTSLDAVFHLAAVLALLPISFTLAELVLDRGKRV
jgi:hypothetical protein